MTTPTQQGANPNTAIDAAAINPSDATELPVPCRAIYVGASGDLKIKTLGGNEVCFPGVPAGIFTIGARQVFLTGTTATNLIALY